MKAIGVLIPPANIRCEREYPAAMPGGYSAHFTRLERHGKDLTASSLIKMKDSSIEAAARLAPTEPLAIAYACTSGSFLSGSKAHDEIAKRIEEAISVPAITTASAVIAGLRSLGIRNIGLLTPYPAAIAAAAGELLADHGFTVAGVSSYNYSMSRDIAAIVPESIRDRTVALANETPSIDGVFVSCTNVATFPVLEQLEAQLGIPVLSSNSATLCAVLRLAGFQGPLPHLGQVGSVAMDF